MGLNFRESLVYLDCARRMLHLTNYGHLHRFWYVAKTEITFVFRFSGFYSRFSRWKIWGLLFLSEIFCLLRLTVWREAAFGKLQKFSIRKAQLLDAHAQPMNFFCFLYSAGSIDSLLNQTILLCNCVMVAAFVNVTLLCTTPLMFQDEWLSFSLGYAATFWMFFKEIANSTQLLSIAVSVFVWSRVVGDAVNVFATCNPSVDIQRLPANFLNVLFNSSRFLESNLWVNLLEVSNSGNPAVLVSDSLLFLQRSETS